MADRENDRQRISQLASEGPGSDPTDPYEKIDIRELPDWWRESIEEFENHDLRPYRPPRFEDGVLKYSLIKKLEEVHKVQISLMGINPQEHDLWTIYIDGMPIGNIRHRRDTAGYTVFEMKSDEFRKLIEESISD